MTRLRAQPLTIRDAVHDKAEMLARLYSLPVGQLDPILAKTLWLVDGEQAVIDAPLRLPLPRLSFWPSLEDALSQADSVSVLDLFESCEDLQDLRLREMYVEDWASFDMLFRDRTGFRRVIEEFIRELRNGREFLLSTGYPRTFFTRSTWFRESIGNLYPTRVALSRDVGSMVSGHPRCEYMWGRVPGSDWRYVNVIYKKRPPEACDYEDAALLAGLTSVEADKLEQARPTILDLKIKVLETYHEALSGRDSTSPWDICRELLKDALLHQQAEFFLDVDRRVGGHDVGTGKRSHPTVPLPLGGLSSILEFVVLAEVEFRSSVFSGIHESLRSAGLLKQDPKELDRVMLGISSYYAAVGKPAQKTLDRCLNRYVGIRGEPDPGFRDARELIKNSLQGDLAVEVTFLRRVPFRNAIAYQKTMDKWLDVQLTSYEQAGQPAIVPIEIRTAGAGPTRARARMDLFSRPPFESKADDLELRVGAETLEARIGSWRQVYAWSELFPSRGRAGRRPMIIIAGLQYFARHGGVLRSDDADLPITWKRNARTYIPKLRTWLREAFRLSSDPIRYERARRQFLMRPKIIPEEDVNFPTPNGATWSDVVIAELEPGHIEVSVQGVVLQGGGSLETTEDGVTRRRRETAVGRDVRTYKYTLQELGLTKKGRNEVVGKTLIEVLRGGGRIQRPADDEALPATVQFLQTFLDIPDFPFQVSSDRGHGCTWIADFKASSRQRRE